MAFKKSLTSSTVPDSPDRLFLDLPLRKHASLFDHQGQVLRNYVSSALNEPDVALQLPTGSGKTLVGLLLAEWRRRKFKEKVVYLCPTRQLVNQVAEEAKLKYGLNIQPFTGKVKEYLPAAKTAYKDGNSVAVTTYNSLFNTNPFFYCALLALILGLCAGHRLFLSSIECSIQSSVKDFVFSYKKSLFVGKSEDCSRKLKTNVMGSEK